MPENFKPGDRVQVFNPDPRSTGTVVAHDTRAVRPCVVVQFDNNLPGVTSSSLVELLRKIDDGGPAPGSPVLRTPALEETHER